MLTKDQEDFYNDRFGKKRYLRPLDEVKEERKFWKVLGEFKFPASKSEVSGESGRVVGFYVDELIDALEKHRGEIISKYKKPWSDEERIDYFKETTETTEEYETRIKDFEKYVVRDYNQYLKSQKISSFQEVREIRIQKLRTQISKLQKQLKDEQNRCKS